MADVMNLMVENPFHNYSSRPDIIESFNITKPNAEVEKRVVKLLEVIKKKKRPCAILPILGEAGYGKTHFYHRLQKQIGSNDAYVVYVPSPSNPNRIFSHLYFETIKAGGAPLLDYISDYLYNTYKTPEKAAFEFTGGGNIVIEGFFALRDPKLSKFALKWLTGFDVDSETFNPRHTILDDEDLAFMALKIVLRCVGKPIVFYIDELESLFISLGPEAELQLLESLKKMYNEGNNFLICLACLTTLWDKILELSSTAVQSRIEPPAILKRFTKSDIKKYALSKMKDFHTKLELEDDDNPLWPISTAEIESAYAYSHGNPREAIKWLASAIEEKKESILELIEKNNRQLKKKGNEIKKIIRKIDNCQSGFLLKKNGALISIVNKKQRILLVLPPIKDIDEIFRKSFENFLKEMKEEEDYNVILMLDDKQMAKNTDMKLISSKDLENNLLEIID